jgi:hypothetical protein
LLILEIIWFKNINSFIFDKFSTGHTFYPLAKIFKTAINIKTITKRVSNSKFYKKKIKQMSKKKNSTKEDIVDKKKVSKDPLDEEAIIGEDSAIDPAIIEDTLAEDFAEYNDVDNF